MSEGMVGLGTTLAGASIGTIGSIISVSIGGRTRDKVDKTTCDTVNGIREKLVGLTEPGQLSVTFNYGSSAVWGTIEDWWASGSTDTFTITYPDDETWAGVGFISDPAIDEPGPEGLITGSFTIELTAAGSYS